MGIATHAHHKQSLKFVFYRSRKITLTRPTTQPTNQPSLIWYFRASAVLSNIVKTWLQHVSLKNFHDFPWPPRIIFHNCNVTQQRTIFYFYIITSIRNIKFYQLQTIHPIYYITLTKLDCQLASEMSHVKLPKQLSFQFNDFSFPWRQSFSMTFQAWKIPFLNSMTFQDVCEPCESPLILHSVWRHSLRWDEQSLCSMYLMMPCAASSCRSRLNWTFPRCHLLLYRLKVRTKVQWFQVLSWPWRLQQSQW